MAARAPRLTAHRALHALFAALHRSHPGATFITFINDGGRSKLTVTDYDGTTAHLAPVMHRQLWDATLTAAEAAARAVHGPRGAWPVRLRFEAPTEPLAFEDAAFEMGDIVVNNRVYTFTPAAVAAVDRIMAAKVMLPLGITEPYDEACDALATALGLPPTVGRLRAYMLARSYARRAAATG
jgi:hypothetical protein